MIKKISKYLLFFIFVLSYKGTTVLNDFTTITTSIDMKTYDIELVIEYPANSIDFTFKEHVNDIFKYSYTIDHKNYDEIDDLVLVKVEKNKLTFFKKNTDPLS